MTSPPQRQLGADGPAVSAVGLGCMSISWGYYLDPQEEAVSERTLQRAVELGVTHFDTASLYGRGHNETLVGRALRDRPDGVLIASKCGLENRGFPRRKTLRDGRPETIRRQCEGSLSRLGIDVLDLYYLHRVDRTCRSRRASARSPSSSGRARSGGWGSPSAPSTRSRAPTRPIR